MTTQAQTPLAVAKIKIQAVREHTRPDGTVHTEAPSGGTEVYEVHDEPKLLKTCATVDAVQRAGWTAFVYGRADVTVTMPDGETVTCTMRVSS